MNNTIPFHSAPHAPQITVDVNILTMLKQAASCLTEAAGRDVYLAAIGPDMELTIIMEEDAPSVLPCFDEDDALITVKGAPLFISYNPAQVLKLAGKRYLTGPVIFYRTDGHSTIVSLTVEDLVDEADLLALMEEDAADAYTAEKEAAAQAEQDRLKAEEEAKKAAEEAASGEEQPKENKVTKIASGFLGVVVLIALAAGGGFYAFTKQKQKKQAEKEALDPDANYTEDKGDFEIPTDVPDEDEAPDEQDTEPI